MIHRLTIQEYPMANGGKSYSLGVDGVAAEGGVTLYIDDRKSRPEEILVELLQKNVSMGESVYGKSS